MFSAPGSPRQADSHEDSNNELEFICSELDSVLLNLLRVSELLLEKRDELNSLVRTGFLNITKLRLRHGSVAFSALSIPKTEFEAKVGVTFTDEESPHFFELVRLSTQREGGPMNWYRFANTELLRTARQNFNDALQVALAVSNHQTTVSKLLEEYKRLFKEKVRLQANENIGILPC